MRITATIYPDGRVQYHGYTPMKSSVLDIRNGFITIHHPGGTYWDNGGAHYVAAYVEVQAIVSLQRGDEPDTWIIEFSHGPGSIVAKFHPSRKTAVQQALHILHHNGDQIAERLRTET